MQTLMLIFHVLVAAVIIGLVLLQHGKGADMGAAFGSGSTGSLFGASGSANFLSRTTAVLTAVFFATSLTLTYLSAHRTERRSAILGQPVTQEVVPPAPADGSKAGEVPK
ncbi:MAG: preprotein translocase subunit SecG [Betaproteobacteria bacterium]